MGPDEKSIYDKRRLLSIIGNHSAENGDRRACYPGASVFLLAVSAGPIGVIATAFSRQAVPFGSV